MPRSCTARWVLFSLLLVGSCGDRPLIADFSLLSDEAGTYHDQDLTLVGAISACHGDTVALFSDASGNRVMLLDDSVERVSGEDLAARDRPIRTNSTPAASYWNAVAGSRVALNARLLPLVTPVPGDSFPFEVVPILEVRDLSAVGCSE